MKKLKQIHIKYKNNPYIQTQYDKMICRFIKNLATYFPTTYSSILQAKSPSRRKNIKDFSKKIRTNIFKIFIFCQNSLMWIESKDLGELSQSQFNYSIGTKLNWIFSGRKRFRRCQRNECQNKIFEFHNVAISDVYPAHCSYSCSSLDQKVILSRKKTSKELYGDENYVNRQKREKTCREKYGCKSYSSTKQFKSMMRRKSGMIKGKEIATKKINGTLNSSKEQEECLNFLKSMFGENNVFSEFKSEKYPFYCDFYIKTLELYVELNAHWTHGKIPFEKRDKKCLKQLNDWKKKSEKSDYFKVAIQTWTIRDVVKRNLAKKNKLNFIEFFSKDDLLKHFSEYKKRSI